jgi:hypothetical protein
MKFTTPFTRSLFLMIITTGMIGMIAISDTPVVNAKTKTSVSSLTTGYSALKLFLEDEQYLKFVRRTNMLITFDSISDPSRLLIDSISDTAEQHIDELEKLALEKPVIQFVEFSDDTIAKATFDSLRLTTAKEFLFDADEFEKNVLLSQLKVLRVISHLAIQLEQKETNSRRKKWLKEVSIRYERYYQQVYASITITAKG